MTKSYSYTFSVSTDDYMFDEIDLNDLWIDVLSFTKRDFQEIEIIRDFIVAEGFFKGDRDKCLILALAIWVNDGAGMKEPNC